MWNIINIKWLIEITEKVDVTKNKFKKNYKYQDKIYKKYVCNVIYIKI